MKLRIRSKLLMSFMVMVALIIALIVFALFSMRIMANGNRQVVYVLEKESLVSDMQITLDRAVTALGDYLLSGKKSRRDTFIQLVFLYNRQLEALEQYQKFCPDGAEEIGIQMQRKITELKAEKETMDKISRELMALADKIKKERGHEIIKEIGEALKGALSSKGETEDSGQPMKDLKTLGELLGVSTHDAQRRFEELECLSRTLSESRWQELSSQLIKAKDRALEKIGEIRELAQLEGELAVKMAAHAKSEARKYMVVGAVVILTMGLGLALYLSRSFSKPIMELEKGARLIGEGDFNHRMALQTGDEIEELASRFNTMATKLEASYHDLEEKVRERTHELEQSHEQLRRLFDGISDGISEIGRDYKVASANQGIARMVGKSEDEIMGINCFRAYNGSDSVCPGCPAGETFRTGIPSSAQLRWTTPGQKVKEMEICIFPLLEEEGKITCVIEYAKDISDKKAMEHKLFQSAKLAGIGTLAAGVAHEIRNPLGIIKTSADIIRRNSREEEQNFEMAEFIIGEVDRLNRVVSRLLNFAKPSKPLIRSCGIHEILDRALALVGPQYRMKDFEVVKTYKENIPPVLGDQEQLCQVFLNLIINAAQAMSDGGCLVLTTGAQDEEGVWVSVSDTGQGIDENTLNNIFNPFFTTKDSGSGLGLAIVFRIVETHKGRVEVQSTPGKGTTFTVMLPSV